MKTAIQAHRGSSAYRPENTLEAFSLAVEQGADGIELDVQITKDDVIVAAHDEYLERVSDGKGCISDYTLDELKTFNFGKLFPDAVCRVPSLAEVFSLIKPSNLTLNIELKMSERVRLDLPGKLAALTKEYGMEDRVIYSSFNHYFLQMIKKINPSAKTGMLYDLVMVDPWVYAAYIGVDFIHPNFRIIAALPDTVKRCHDNGIGVNVWTVDDPQAVKLMMHFGVDSLITNKPDTALSCRGGLI